MRQEICLHGHRQVGEGSDMSTWSRQGGGGMGYV